MTPEGLVSVRSRFEPAETAQRLVAAITDRGMSVMARVDHAAAAQAVGLDLRPTEVVMFGNPKAGTPLMQAAQTVGIDVPLKALVWQDENGLTFVSYNDPLWIAARHGLVAERPVRAMADALATVVGEATGNAPSEGDAP